MGGGTATGAFGASQDFGGAGGRKGHQPPPERDLGLRGESLGEVPVAQVSDGYPSALRASLLGLEET